MSAWLQPTDAYDHGTRVRYVAGCRCQSCIDASTRYCRQRYLARAKGQSNGWVSPHKAQLRLLELAKLGIGLHRAAELAHISVSTAQRIRSGQANAIRARVDRAIQQIPPSLAKGQRVNSYQTKRLVRCLEKEGFTKAALASKLGLRGKRLTFHPKVTVRNALKVRALWEQISA